jgi:hypothetical protein
MKTCIACKYFRIDPSYRYSTYTAGSASVNCDKHHFAGESLEDVQEVSLSKANTCPDYELSDLAKSKGWTE